MGQEEYRWTKTVDAITTICDVSTNVSVLKEARRTFPIHPDIDPPVVAASASSSGEENAEKLLLRLKNEKFETAEPADNVYEDESLVNKEMAEVRCRCKKTCSLIGECGSVD